MRTIYSLGIKLNPLSVDEITSYTNKWLEGGKKGFQITGLNLEQIALLNKNKDFINYINSSEIVNIDGTCVVWYLKMIRYKSSYRTLCADILYAMFNTANEKGQSIYFLGAEEDTIKKLVGNIQEKYPNIRIVGYHNGFFKEEKLIIKDISEKSPDYLFIGMPSPFKERFISTYKNELNAGICFGVGGMFDIIAGKAKRAPKGLQRIGLEWVFRITQNPVGHSKRILKAFPSCLKVFMKNFTKDRELRKKSNLR